MVPREKATFADDVSARSVGKMADFDPLHLSKFKSNVHVFLQGFSYRVLIICTR